MDAITIGRWSIQTGLKSLKRDKEEEKSLKDTQELNADTLNRIRRLKATVDGEHEWFLCMTKNKNACEDTDNDK